MTSALAQRIWRVLETGGRKQNVLRGLAKTQVEFEQAVGQLFLAGTVQWNGRKSGRVLQRKARK